MNERKDTDWSSLGQKLIEERRQTQFTSVASPSFVDRMTSATADPAEAAKEADRGAKPAADAEKK
jgi:hypothetical protein